MMPFELPQHPTPEQRRALALALSIESIVQFEQPRDGTYRRTASETSEFIDRAMKFESYLKEGKSGS